MPAPRPSYKAALRTTGDVLRIAADLEPDATLLRSIAADLLAQADLIEVKATVRAVASVGRSVVDLTPGQLAACNVLADRFGSVRVTPGDWAILTAGHWTDEDTFVGVYTEVIDESGAVIGTRACDH